MSPGRATDLTNYTLTLANLCFVKGETPSRIVISIIMDLCRNGDG